MTPAFGEDDVRLPFLSLPADDDDADAGADWIPLLDWDAIVSIEDVERIDTLFTRIAAASGVVALCAFLMPLAVGLWERFG